FAAMVEHGFGDRPHYPYRAAAENQSDAVAGEDGAEGACGFHESRVGAGAGSAIDADCPDFADFFVSVHAYACASHLRHRQGGPGRKSEALQRMISGRNSPM